MEIMCIAPKGFEEQAAAEIKELIGVKSNVSEGLVFFSCENLEDAAKLCYLSQSLIKVTVLLKTISLDGDAVASIDAEKKIDLSKWLEDKTFKAVCMQDIKIEIDSMKMAAKIGEKILQGTDTTVKMDNPDMIVLSYVSDEKAYIGIDLAGVDLSKREYKVYNHPRALNGSVAFCLLEFAGWKPGKNILDPMCGSGVIAAEAALKFMGKSPQFFSKEKLAFTKIINLDFADVDSKAKPNDPKLGKEAGINCSDNVLTFIRSVKNNAKIADVDKLINATKNDLEWLETKFDENSVDCIVSHPPPASKHANIKDVMKIYRELFYQAEYILKDSGNVTLITQTPVEIEDAATDKGFILKKRKEVWQGRQKMHALSFIKKNPEINKN